MSIWKSPLTLEELALRSHKTLSDYLGIEFMEIGDNFLLAKMPVTDHHKQPMGLMHGGASAALAETVGSVCALMSVHPTKESIVGLELNINHLRAIKEGYVYAKCSPFHLGRTTHVWDIKITNEKDQLISVGRLTTMVINQH